MTRTRATACAVALLLSATAATAGTATNVPYPVPRSDFENQLPVPEHSIGQACGSLKYQGEIAQCTRSEEMHNRYVTRTWGTLSIKEQKEADDLVSAKGFNYDRFYGYLANYIEAKMRQRRQLD
ncbi:hypothetical protein [Methylobacterium longum]|uniref:Uncharacterized protein n=1 Tax=Methylobacterium longum TaxID=767694 RepID=A0ABT8AQD9_9HYPH|nr:hypothetical protein [Methylobacterium longum]MDN3571589.1 hypothetical protein [Methylobacterium longum]